MNKDKVKGGGQALDGFSRRTGFWKRCCMRDSEYHRASKHRLRGAPRSESAPGVPETRRVHRPPDSTISTETPVSAEGLEQSVRDKGANASDQSFSPTLDSVD